MSQSLPGNAMLPTAPGGDFTPRLRARRVFGAFSAILFCSMSLTAVLVLGVLLWQVTAEGAHRLSTRLITNFPSQLFPDAAGLKSAFWGTIWLVALTSLFSITVGMGAAIYLEEYAARSRMRRVIDVNISNLSGVPSIVYGILGMALFVRWMHLGESILSGALTLTLVILPVIVIAGREAVAQVPNSTRQAAYALGATKWQTVWHHVLPAAMPGALTGIIIAVSRAIGETAPLIMIGAVGFLPAVPGRTLLPPSLDTAGTWFGEVLKSRFTAMPIQIYDWSGRPQVEFQELAAAGIILLLAVLLTLNSIAAGLRAWRQGHRVHS